MLVACFVIFSKSFVTILSVIQVHQNILKLVLNMLCSTHFWIKLMYIKINHFGVDFGEYWGKEVEGWVKLVSTLGYSSQS